MLGGGFAFALLPVLRRVLDGSRLQDAVRRHSEHFNAHPYLAGLALGAAAKLEADGGDPELVRRFKLAIKGPLGGLGDALVWAAWLPTTALLGLVAFFMGAAPWVCVLLFLIPYNVGHLGLRVWGFNAGLTWGHDVGRVLRDAALGHRAEQVCRAGVVLLGVLAGLLLTVEPDRSAGAFRGGALEALWLVLAAAAFAAGLLGGARAWRPAALVAVGTVVSILTVAAR
jgi:mannose/fructose/N-acetylgalactosamine-specific phosphotransferase system component IID